MPELLSRSNLIRSICTSSRSSSRAETLLRINLTHCGGKVFPVCLSTKSRTESLRGSKLVLISHLASISEQKASFIQYISHPQYHDSGTDWSLNMISVVEEPFHPFWAIRPHKNSNIFANWLCCHRPLQLCHAYS